MADDRPRILVFSSLFPHEGDPNAGLFVRERMFRVGRRLPLVVVSPQPWFPFQGFIRRFRPNYRPSAPASATDEGIEVLYPRFLAVPLLFRSLDGLLMALGSLPTLLRLQRRFRPDVIDAHFAYPSGYAATWLGRWLRLPVTITMRGTEARHSRDPILRGRVARALSRATRVFAVSESLKGVALGLSIPEAKLKVVGNGVDLAKFFPESRDHCRRELGLPANARVLISVGGLVERKGFHRVIACLPRLCARFPDLRYLVVGGPSPEGDMSAELRHLATKLGVSELVVFAGPVKPDALRMWLGAADVFVLSTRYEGWANVFLEAIACGLPVVTTDVGGNSEVVCKPELGRIIPFGDSLALEAALQHALDFRWDRTAIAAYAKSNAWDHRIDVLVDEFRAIQRDHGNVGRVRPDPSTEKDAGTSGSSTQP